MADAIQKHAQADSRAEAEHPTTGMVAREFVYNKDVAYEEGIIKLEDNTFRYFPTIQRLALNDVGNDAAALIGYDDTGNNYVTGETVRQAFTSIESSLETFAAGGIGSFTEGAVLFGGASGEITENPTGLTYDSVNDYFGVGTDVPEYQLHIVSTAPSIVFEDSEPLSGGESRLQMLFDDGVFYLRSLTEAGALVLDILEIDTGLGWFIAREAAYFYGVTRFVENIVLEKNIDQQVWFEDLENLVWSNRNTTVTYQAGFAGGTYDITLRFNNEGVATALHSFGYDASLDEFSHSVDSDTLGTNKVYSIANTSGDFTFETNVTMNGTLDIGSTINIVGTLDDDTFATASNTTLATSESIKAYVDATAAGGGSALDFDGDTGSGTINLSTETLGILSGSTSLSTVVSGNNVTISIAQDIQTTASPNFVDLDLTGYLNIGSTINIVGTLDDDTFATASATTLATSESIKAYVDAAAGGGGGILNFDGDTGSGAINLSSETLSFDVAATLGTADVSGNTVVFNPVQSIATSASPTFTNLSLTNTSTTSLDVSSNSDVILTLSADEDASGSGHAIIRYYVGNGATPVHVVGYRAASGAFIHSYNASYPSSNVAYSIADSTGNMVIENELTVNDDILLNEAVTIPGGYVNYTGSVSIGMFFGSNDSVNVRVPTNDAAAFSIADSGNNFLSIGNVYGSEFMDFGNASNTVDFEFFGAGYFTVNPIAVFERTTYFNSSIIGDGVVTLTVPDNYPTAFSVTHAGNSYINIDTSNFGETITLGYSGLYDVEIFANSTTVNNSLNVGAPNTGLGSLGVYNIGSAIITYTGDADNNGTNVDVAVRHSLSSDFKVIYGWDGSEDRFSLDLGSGVLGANPMLTISDSDINLGDGATYVNLMGYVWITLDLDLDGNIDVGGNINLHGGTRLGSQSNYPEGFSTQSAANSGRFSLGNITLATLTPTSGQDVYGFDQLISGHVYVLRNRSASFTAYIIDASGTGVVASIEPHECMLFVYDNSEFVPIEYDSAT